MKKEKHALGCGRENAPGGGIYYYYPLSATIFHKDPFILKILYGTREN